MGLHTQAGWCTHRRDGRQVTGSGFVRFTAGIFLGVLTFCAVSTLQVPSAGASSAAWTVSAQFPGTITSLQAVSCWSTSDCMTLGNNGGGMANTLTTTDGGNTWTNNPGGGDSDTVSDVSCGSSSDCVVVGTYLDAGFAWAT